MTSARKRSGARKKITTCIFFRGEESEPFPQKNRLRKNLIPPTKKNSQKEERPPPSEKPPPAEQHPTTAPPPQHHAKQTAEASPPPVTPQNPPISAHQSSAACILSLRVPECRKSKIFALRVRLSPRPTGDTRHRTAGHKKKGGPPFGRPSSEQIGFASRRKSSAHATISCCRCSSSWRHPPLQTT